MRDLARPLPDGAHIAILTDKSGEQALAADPPRRRARARDGGDGALPGREDLDRPADRGRLLLRLRVPRRRRASPRRTSRRSKSACARTSRPPSRSCARTCRSAQARERFARRASGLQGRADRRPRARPPSLHREPLQTVSLYTNGPFTDLCRGPHAPSTKTDRRVQAAVGRRRLLARATRPARCSRASTAPRSSPRPSSSEHLERLEQARARDHRKLGRELGLFTFSELSPGAAFWMPRRHDACATRWWRSRAQMGAERGYTEVKTPQIYDAELWQHLRALGQVPRATCSSLEVEGREMGVKPMNCPGHCAPVRDRRATPTATCRCATSSRACCTATSPPACCTGCCACATSPRTTRTSSAPRSRSQDEVTGCLEMAFDDLRAVRLRGAPRALDAPRAARSATDEMWDRAEAQLTRALDELGLALRAQPRRRRLLRAEDRHAHDRLARALLAARHGPARLLDARALRADLHRRRQRRAPPGDDPPRAVRLLRALHRDHARALRRRAAAVARARAGDRAARLRPLQRLRAPTVQRRARARTARASSSTTAASRWGARSATRSCARSPTCSSSASASSASGTVSVREHARRATPAACRSERVHRRGSPASYTRPALKPAQILTAPRVASA